MKEVLIGGICITLLAILGGCDITENTEEPDIRVSLAGGDSLLVPGEPIDFQIEIDVPHQQIGFIAYAEWVRYEWIPDLAVLERKSIEGVISPQERRTVLTITLPDSIWYFASQCDSCRAIGVQIQGGDEIFRSEAFPLDYRPFLPLAVGNKWVYREYLWTSLQGDSDPYHCGNTIIDTNVETTWEIVNVMQMERTERFVVAQHREGIESTDYDRCDDETKPVVTVDSFFVYRRDDGAFVFFQRNPFFPESQSSYPEFPGYINLAEDMQNNFSFSLRGDTLSVLPAGARNSFVKNVGLISAYDDFYCGSGLRVSCRLNVTLESYELN